MAKIYGHRGARGERPENSLAGFHYAKSLRVAGIETDIAMTADNVPVLHHDPHLADGRLICTLPYAALVDVPTLAEALTAITDIDWLLEIKTYPLTPNYSHPPAQVVAQVLAALSSCRIPPERVKILAFEWRVLTEVVLQNPAIARVCLTAPATEDAALPWWGRAKLGSTAKTVSSFGASAWGAFHGTLTPQAIAEAKAMGLQVCAWTVNDAESFDRLSTQLDGVITDFPSRFL